MNNLMHYGSDLGKILPGVKLSGEALSGNRPSRYFTKPSLFVYRFRTGKEQKMWERGVDAPQGYATTAKQPLFVTGLSCVSVVAVSPQKTLAVKQIFVFTKEATLLDEKVMSVTMPGDTD